jgi:hypothetical protein
VKRSLLLLLSACSGDPFTLLVSPATDAPIFAATADTGAEHVKPPDIDAPTGAPVDAPTDAPGDASPEATSDVGSEATPEPAPEASTIDAGAPEVSPPPDAGPWVLPDACTPFPAPITWAPSCDGIMATVPSDFFVILGNQACGGQPMGAQLAQATPKQCQCQESYSCACLEAYGACGGRKPSSCTPSPNANTEIYVTCN